MSSVLVVDDEPLIRVSIASMVRANAPGIAHVYTAANGREALEILACESDVKLVLLDLAMPVMDGLEFLARIGVRGQDLQVVVLSSHDDYSGVREAFRLGADDYLLKSSLAPSMLAPLLERAAATGPLQSAHERPQLQKHNLRALQRGLLRELLTGQDVPDPEERLARLSVELKPPIVLLGIWVRDLLLVRMRYDAAGLDRFHSMLPEYVAEIVERQAFGFVCPIDHGHVVAVLHSREHLMDDPGRLHRLGKRIVETLQHHLNVEVSQSRGAAVADVDELGRAYARIAGSRPMATRTVSRAKGHIHQHYADPDLSLEQMAAVAGVSRTHLSAQFRKETGVSITEYLTMVRVEAAKQLLAGTDLRVYEVAERVGFASSEHFSRVFKRSTGIPPGSFAATSVY